MRDITVHMADNMRKRNIAETTTSLMSKASLIFLDPNSFNVFTSKYKKTKKEHNERKAIIV
jgi:hypothetical protein